MKCGKLGKCICMSMIFSGIVNGTNVEAGEKDISEYTLEGIIVTATSTPVERIKTAASLTVITSEEIEAKQYRNMYELLEQVPGINTRLYSNGVGYELSGYSVPSIRGKYALVLIDGVNQSIDNKARNALLDINPKDIERVEILKGSASVLYGSNAIGGVINIITKRATGKNVSSIKYATGNFGYNSYNFNTRGNNEKAFWALNLEKQNSGDFTDGGGVNHPTDKDVKSANVKFGYSVNDKLDLIVKYDSSHQDMRWTDLYTSGWQGNNNGIFNLDSLTFIADFVDRQNGEGNNFSAFSGTMEAVRNYNNNRTVASDGSISVADTSEKYKYNVLRITDKYYKQINKEHRILAGGEYSAYKDRYLDGKNQLKESSVYLQDEWDIVNNLKLTSGIRYVVPGDFGSKWVSSFNLGYTPNEKTGFYVARNEFYVQPTMSQVFGNYLYNPNSDLKPTSGNTIEMGINYQADKSTFLNANIYRRNEENSISWINDGSGKRKYVNVDQEVISKGFELSVEKKFNKYLSGKAGYFHTWSKPAAKLSFSPQDIITLSLNYTKDKINLGIDGVGKYKLYGKDYRYTDSIPETTFWVWNLHANYQAMKNVKIFAKVNNLLDKEFSNVGNWLDLNNGTYDYLNYCGEGRSFVVGMEYTF